MFKELKREAYEANVALPRHGLINLTFGNASAVDRARAVFAIKPSGVDYAALTPEDMVLVDLEGRTVEGRLNPSSDTPTHRRLFLAFPNIGGVVHTHSSHATAFAQAGRPDPDLRHDARRLFQRRGARHPQDDAERDRRRTTNGRRATSSSKRCRTAIRPTCPGVLVNRHAPFTWGSSVAKAVEVAVAVECIAHMALMSLQLNPDLEPIEEELLNKHFQAQARPGRLLRAVLRPLRLPCSEPHPRGGEGRRLHQDFNLPPKCSVLAATQSFQLFECLFLSLGC